MSLFKTLYWFCNTEWRSIICVLLLALMGVLCSSVVTAQVSNPESANSNQQGYRLGAGDVIRIEVLGESDLSLELQLGDSGSFTYPFLGELSISGKTPAQVENMIEQGLKGDYLIDPRVNVSVNRYREIFVSGEVSREGNFRYQPGLTVGKAIVLAGGFTERAIRNRVKVVTEVDGSVKTLTVDTDHVLKPGDIVTVQRRFF